MAHHQQQENHHSTTSSSLFTGSGLFSAPRNDDDRDQRNNASILSDLDATTAGLAASRVCGGLAACTMRAFAARWSGGAMKKFACVLYFLTVFSCRLLLKSAYAEQLDETTLAVLQDLLSLCPFLVGILLLSRGHEALLRPKPPPSPAAPAREPGAVSAPAIAEVRPAGPENLKLYLFMM